MTTFSERYRKGERSQVWRDLVALGSAVREEPLYSDARLVAQMMMRRARYNMERIVARLHQLQYRFDVRPDLIFETPNDKTLAAIALLRNAVARFLSRFGAGSKELVT